MPAKKQTETRVTKTTKKTLKPKSSEVKQVEYIEPVTEVKHTEAVDQNNEKVKKSVRKAGRTILVKSNDSLPIDGSIFDSFEGLTNKAETKSTNSFFLTFDSVTNAVSAFRTLRTESSKYRVKFSYYRIFFTMDGLTESSDYNQVKKELMDYVAKQTTTTVLYCKFYRKDNKYLGCGDFTIDTLTGMNTLLAKDSGNNEYSFDSYKGTFYRYNGKKNKPIEQQVMTN